MQLRSLLGPIMPDEEKAQPTPSVPWEFWQRFKGMVIDSCLANLPAAGTCRCSRGPRTIASGRRKVQWIWEQLYSHPRILPKLSSADHPENQIDISSGDPRFTASCLVWSHLKVCKHTPPGFIAVLDSKCFNCPFQFPIKPLVGGWYAMSSSWDVSLPSIEHHGL